MPIVKKCDILGWGTKKWEGKERRYSDMSLKLNSVKILLVFIISICLQFLAKLPLKQEDCVISNLLFLKGDAKKLWIRFCFLSTFKSIW